MSKIRPISFSFSATLANFSFLISHFSFIVALIALSSCQFEDEDYFDESASLRVEHTNEEVQRLLVQPEHGWVMQYFCGTSIAHFEGFNILARFDNGGKVTLASNHRYLRDGQAGKYTESSSTYELLLEDGPVLAINTWNDVLMPFVDPVSPWQAPGLLNKDGAGMLGDNNFVVMSYSDQELLLRGERYSGQTRLIPCDRPWEDYLAACDSIKQSVSGGLIDAYYIKNSTDTLYITGLSSGRIRYSERLDDPLKNDSLSAVYTPTGLRLERPDTIGSDAFQEFTLADDGTELRSVDGKVQVSAYLDSVAVARLRNSSGYDFDKRYFTDEQKAIYDEIVAAIAKVNVKWTISNFGIGMTTGANGVSGLIFTVALNDSKKNTRKGGMSLAIAMASGADAVTISSDNPTFDSNVTAFIRNGATGLDDMLKRFAATLDGTYGVGLGGLFLPQEKGTKFKLN